MELKDAIDFDYCDSLSVAAESDEDKAEDSSSVLVPDTGSQ